MVPIAASIEKLNHFSSRVRLKAIDDLVDTHDARVVPALVNMLGIEDQPNVSKHLFARLGEFNHPLVLMSAMAHFEQFYKLSWRDEYRELIEIACNIIQT